MRHLPALVLPALLTGTLVLAPPTAHADSGSCVEDDDHACISKAEREKLEKLEKGMIPRRVRTIVGGRPEESQKAAPACTCPGKKRLSYIYGRSGSDGHLVIVFRPGKQAGTWRLERTHTVD